MVISWKKITRRLKEMNALKESGNTFNAANKMIIASDDVEVTPSDPVQKKMLEKEWSMAYSYQNNSLLVLTTEN